MFSYSCVPGTRLMLVPSAFLVKSIPDRREITNNQTSCKLPSSTSFIKTLQELLSTSKTDSFPFTFLNYSIGLGTKGQKNVRYTHLKGRIRTHITQLKNKLIFFKGQKNDLLTSLKKIYI